MRHRLPKSIRYRECFRQSETVYQYKTPPERPDFQTITAINGPLVITGIGFKGQNPVRHKIWKSTFNRDQRLFDEIHLLMHPWMTFQILVQLGRFQNNFTKNPSTFIEINLETNPLSWTPFFTSRPNNQNSNAQWHDFSLHCLLLFQICHVARLESYPVDALRGCVTLVKPVVNLSFHYHLSSWFPREKACCVPYKIALIGF